MRHGFRSRATALILAALFLGGAGGASDLDAFLFHPAGNSVAAGVPHIETAGNPNCHTERCVLALRLANGRVAHALAVPVRVEGMPLIAVPARPAAEPLRFFPGRHRQSRAPPGFLA
ncbi:MAG TPA: hypothetical protein VMT21_01065 [Gemmatimonadales bacterium]|nr:hypothetical protein [Gemmatimonadales bacterium]